MMNAENLMIGFVSGFVSGVVLLFGTWYWMMPKLPALIRKEAVRDLTHFGRNMGKAGLEHIGNWVKNRP